MGISPMPLPFITNRRSRPCLPTISEHDRSQSPNEKFPMLISVAVLPLFISSFASAATTNKLCRSQPGDASFPSAKQFSQLNSSVEGRLLHVVPSGRFCKERSGGCTDAEWANSIFRSNIPGAMLQPNWEQDYLSDPPSICFRNTSSCGQGVVPVYAINATTAAHIQAGVSFAQKHNLKVAIKASGHDYLGRSTAKGSLLLWTRYMERITFHDSFVVAGENKGSAVTVGSGLGLHKIYQATKARGKIFVGGTAANVVAAGGYLQGAGHSALSPLLGLAADNALEFEVVIANGSVVTANEASHADLFWAMRGGGAGSWGVVISATFRTFPTFDIAQHLAVISLNSSAEAVRLIDLHAKHIFDWDSFRVGQYFYVLSTPPPFTFLLNTTFPHTSLEDAEASIRPFMREVARQGFNIVSDTLNRLNVNDALSPDTFDLGGGDFVIGSRLIPADVYRNNVTAISETYLKLLEEGTTVQQILGIGVAGGRVAENANISSAINPKWRSAKSHIIVLAGWNDDTPPDAVEAVRADLTNTRVPMLAALAGPGSGAYSNEADVREPAFQTTFFGPNYARLSAIKEEYDPRGLFVVGAGVGSEKWDGDGVCRIA